MNEFEEFEFRRRSEKELAQQTAKENSEIPSNRR